MALDEDPAESACESFTETVRLLAGEGCVGLLDEAEELAEAARFGRGDGDD
jgi:hypothetical protein